VGREYREGREGRRGKRKEKDGVKFSDNSCLFCLKIVAMNSCLSLEENPCRNFAKICLERNLNCKEGWILLFLVNLKLPRFFIDLGVTGIVGSV
jgi:hypothetical protein